MLLSRIHHRVLQSIASHLPFALHRIFMSRDKPQSGEINWCVLLHLISHLIDSLLAPVLQAKIHSILAEHSTAKTVRVLTEVKRAHSTIRQGTVPSHTYVYEAKYRELVHCSFRLLAFLLSLSSTLPPCLCRRFHCFPLFLCSKVHDANSIRFLDKTPWWPAKARGHDNFAFVQAPAFSSGRCFAYSMLYPLVNYSYFMPLLVLLMDELLHVEYMDEAANVELQVARRH